MPLFTKQRTPADFYRASAEISSFSLSTIAVIVGSVVPMLSGATEAGFRAVLEISPISVAFDTSPCAPVSPAGMVNETSTLFPNTFTCAPAGEPGVPVVTPPICTLENAGPTGPSGPAGPAGTASMSALSAVNCARISAEEARVPLAGFVGSKGIVFLDD